MQDIMIKTLGEILATAANNFGERIALHFEGGEYSYNELNRLSNQVADSLTCYGIGFNSRVVLYAPNSAHWIVSYYAIAKTGATIVPVDSMLIPSEVNFIVNDSAAVLLMTSVTNDEDLYAICEDTAIQNIITLENEKASGALPLSELIKGGNPDFQPVQSMPDTLSTIAYTSGSTGKPKGAMLSHRSVILGAALTVHYHLRNREDVFVSALPCTHVYGNDVILTCFMVGGSLVLLRRFDSEEVMNAIQTYRATMFEGVPTMYFYLLAMLNLSSYDLSSLTRCTVGGQTMPIEKIKEVESMFGCPLIELWGMTETAGVAVTSPFFADKQYGSIGIPLPFIECRIDSQTDNNHEKGVGELCVRGPLVMQGYYMNEKKTAETIDKEGWLHTGDLARQDKGGFIIITGRKKEVIITAGYNIYPQELEEVISQHSDVAMAAVGKVQDEIKGELAVAYVVLKEASHTNEDELKKFCRGLLAPYKVPRQFKFVKDLPKTGSGKVMRHKLHEINA
jgi:long-chain acyl-CoA synthetase